MSSLPLLRGARLAPPPRLREDSPRYLQDAPGIALGSRCRCGNRTALITNLATHQSLASPPYNWVQSTGLDVGTVAQGRAAGVSGEERHRELLIKTC